MLHRDDSVRSQIQHHQFSLPQTGNNIIQNTIGLQVKLLYMHGSKDHLSSHSRGLQISLEGPAGGYKLILVIWVMNDVSMKFLSSLILPCAIRAV